MIPDDSVGASSFQRDMMQLSKLDEVDIKVARLKDLNPLNSIEVQLELLFRHESVPVDGSTGVVKVPESAITEALRTVLNKKFINLHEVFPL